MSELHALGEDDKRDDRQLVRCFLSGDDSAFEALVKKYLSHLYNFIFLFTHDQNVTEDLAQETFIKAWKHIKRFDQEKNFKTWLFTIAKNTTFDSFKKKKSIPFSFFRDDEGKNMLETVSDDGILPDEMIGKAEETEDLNQALERIPELYRALLVLAYREDFSLKEIAVILDEPYNTIKSRHQRAIQLLRKAFVDMDASKNTRTSY